MDNNNRIDRYTTIAEQNWQNGSTFVDTFMSITDGSIINPFTDGSIINPFTDGYNDKWDIEKYICDYTSRSGASSYNKWLINMDIGYKRIGYIQDGNVLNYGYSGPRITKHAGVFYEYGWLDYFIFNYSNDYYMILQSYKSSDLFTEPISQKAIVIEKERIKEFFDNDHFSNSQFNKILDSNPNRLKVKTNNQFMNIELELVNLTNLDIRKRNLYSLMVYPKIELFDKKHKQTVKKVWINDYTREKIQSFIINRVFKYRGFYFVSDGNYVRFLPNNMIPNFKFNNELELEVILNGIYRDILDHKVIVEDNDFYNSFIYSKNYCNFARAFSILKKKNTKIDYKVVIRNMNLSRALDNYFYNISDYVEMVDTLIQECPKLLYDRIMNDNTISPYRAIHVLSKLPEKFQTIETQKHLFYYSGNDLSVVLPRFKKSFLSFVRLLKQFDIKIVKEGNIYKADDSYFTFIENELYEYRIDKHHKFSVEQIENRLYKKYKSDKLKKYKLDDISDDLEISFKDSIKAGNCEYGTENFIKEYLSDYIKEDIPITQMKIPAKVLKNIYKTTKDVQIFRVLAKKQLEVDQTKLTV